ncbi:DUF1704 domain-containing protein [Cryomorpha ignava]|uniref:DUF1704 domain-containing protein n=1 Tax=Cryomorpha ignava TaxID=101383 RepID=A0A7K3WJY4_9FLAO|nr:tyrosine/phenylalanine carboxypeptidase domain-containing protein [Cryomorpha ignava]NEN21939.1 DUF1704 domain-containing protein [Cryomorpha ignava]
MIETIQTVKSKIEAGESINLELPKNGMLHIEKPLPYICVYRFKNDDPYFAGLLKTQASYLIADAELDISELLKEISISVSEKLNAFLILEMWPVRTAHDAQFGIFCPENKAVATIASLKKGFEKIKKIYPGVSAKVINTKNRQRGDLAPLMNVDESKESGSLIIGIAVPAIYQNTAEEEIYSLFYRRFYSYFSEIIKRAAFEFIRVQTSNPFGHYLMLGKTKLEKVTLNADSLLAGISEEMSFLLRVTPVNGTTEWENFQKNNFTKVPAFNYRLISIDPERKKRELYNIPLEKIKDPTIAYILRDKRLEIEKQLTMLEERNTINFRYIGQSLYGKIEDRVIVAANQILEKFPDQDSSEEITALSCHDFARRAQKELDYYQKEFPETPLCLEIRKDVNGIMVSQSSLLISDQFTLDERRCDALIQHEIATHIVTYCNGRNQPLKQMYAGFSRYDQLQEGLAVLAEYLVKGLSINRMRTLAGRVIAAESMVKGASFIETFNLLRARRFSDYTSYYIAMRIYRGGGLVKDAVYLAGLLDVMDYLKKGRNLETLYTGKFNINHVDMIEELMHRNIVKPPVLPRFLQRDSVRVRLEILRHGIEVTELLE